MTGPRTQATRIQRDTGGVTARAGSGWVFFAGTVLFIVGTFNVIWGLTALFNDTALTVGEEGLIVWDFTAWGWIHIILGIVMILTAIGLFGGQGWARWTAVVFAMVNAIAEIGWMTTYPLWSVLIITLNFVVIYQLTARWEFEEARY
jgi:magnesium-transporting ATPase (P-type)